MSNPSSGKPPGDRPKNLDHTSSEIMRWVRGASEKVIAEGLRIAQEVRSTPEFKEPKSAAHLQGMMSQYEGYLSAGKMGRKIADSSARDPSKSSALTISDISVISRLNGYLSLMDESYIAPNVVLDVIPKKRAPGIFEEFFHRKSDGIGMSDRFPRVAQALDVIMDLLPEGITEFDEAQLARLTGNALEKGISIADVASNAISDGPVKFIAEQACERVIESNYGTDAVTAVKEVIEPGSGAIDKAKDAVFVAIGVAATLGTYDLMIKAKNGMHNLDHLWHLKNNKDIGEGSDLHIWAGGDARPKLDHTRSLLDRQNPFGDNVRNPFDDFSHGNNIPDPDRDTDPSNG